jgi:hypothetical protein
MGHREIPERALKLKLNGRDIRVVQAFLCLKVMTSMRWCGRYGRLGISVQNIETDVIIM